jgi:hypothetical protein
VFYTGTDRLDFRLSLEPVVELTLVADKLANTIVEVLGEGTSSIEVPHSTGVSSARHARWNVMSVGDHVAVATR